MLLSFNEWLSIGYYILAMIIVFVGRNITRSWVRIQKEKNDLKNFELNLSTPNNMDALKLLDNLIADTISDYIILNRSSLNLDQNYINAEEETKIIHDIVETVSNRISPILLTKLSIYYTDEAISEIIGNKTYIQTTAYIVSINSVKDDKKE